MNCDVVYGVKSIYHQAFVLTMEKKSNPRCAEDLRTSTRELLTSAQALLAEIQEMIQGCSSPPCSSSRTRRNHKREQSVRAATIREDGETLVIDGFRFEDAASREDLGRWSTTRQNNS